MRKCREQLFPVAVAIRWQSRDRLFDDMRDSVRNLHCTCVLLDGGRCVRSQDGRTSVRICAETEELL